MPLNVGDLSPVSVPPAIGGAVLAAEPLRHGQANPATGGIWRVRGPAGTAILKVARLPAGTDPAKAFPTSDEPGHWNYWRRETFAYETGLAGTAYADAGITAPALLEANTRPSGDVERWLADVSGTGGFDWPVPRLARFARELGATQARWAGRVPPIRWLSRRWLAQYLAQAPNWLGCLAGLREGGWTGPEDAVRTAIHACGAAKYSWFGPAMAVRAARDDLGPSSYRQDTSAAAAIARLTPLVTLIADWAGWS